MNGKQLKNSILQWAIQGKLVPQDPNDEPASVLLEKISAEKVRLVKEGKLKKKDLEVKPIVEDEIPFEIPKGWEWCRLSFIADIVRGGSPRPAGSPEFYGGTIPFLKVADLTKDSEMYVTSYTTTIKEAGLRKTRKVLANTLLLTNSGATLGVPKICTFDTTFNDGIAAFLYLSEEIKPYVYWFLCSLTEYYRNINQGTAQPNLNTDIIKDTLFPVPPINEQARIIKRLEELMPILDKFDKAQAELDEWNQALPEKLKKSILQEAIQGKLVPQDPNEGIAEISNSYKVPRKTSNFDDYLFEIPEKWKWCKLFQIADVIGGYAFQSGDLKSNNGIRVIRISDITPKGLSNKSVVRCSLREIPDQYSIKCNDILIAMTGGTVGKSLLLKSMTEPMYLNQRVAIIRASKDVDVEYLNLVIKSPLIQSIISDVKNSTNDNISMADITGFPFPLPPLAEQRRIVAKIEELFGVIKK